MKPSVTEFADVPKSLNRLKDSERVKIESLIGLLSEATQVPVRIRRTIESLAGRKFEPNYRQFLPERTPLHSADDLERLIPRQYAILAHTPAPRTKQEWEDRITPLAGRLAERLFDLFLSGYWGKLHQCQVCPRWFLARVDARICSAACREKKSERREGFKRRRRAWLIANRLIPRIRSRVEKLGGPANRLRRERWEKRLRVYYDELRKVREGSRPAPAAAVVARKPKNVGRTAVRLIERACMRDNSPTLAEFLRSQGMLSEETESHDALLPLASAGGGPRGRRIGGNERASFGESN